MIESILSCPVCNEKASISRHNGIWLIRCSTCNYILTRPILEDAIIAWNGYVRVTELINKKKLLSKLIIKKEYCGENIADIEEDIYNSRIEANIPKDEYNFENGTFNLLLTWRMNDE